MNVKVKPRQRRQIGGRSSPRRGSGFTLLEVLVATGILVVLGTGLVALMTQAISLWRRAETSGRVFEQARAILEAIASDLRAAVADVGVSSEAVEIRFLCDSDAQGRQRLQFVRAIGGEASDSLLRSGGMFLSTRASAAADGRGDAREAASGELAAPGGLMEVIYALAPRGENLALWHGSRTPIGGVESLFSERAFQASGEESPFSRVARPLTDGVLYLGFAFWGPTTNTWDPREPPLAAPGPKDASGPLRVWDSTRAILDEKNAPRDLFAFRAKLGSLVDPRDDIFPELVEVTLVLRPDDTPLGLVLDRDLQPKAKSLSLSGDPILPEDVRDRVILVGDEWIRIAQATGRTLEIEARGARGSSEASHPAGTPVRIGVTFRRVVEIAGRHRTQVPDAVAEDRGPLGRRRP